MKRYLLALVALLLAHGAAPLVGKAWADAFSNTAPFTSGSTTTATGSTTARTLADRSADAANVLDFNAPDITGATDTSASFAAALARNKRVYVPTGTYGFSTRFFVPAGEHEIVCDRGATFVALPGNTANALFIYADATTTRLTVTGCKFDGSASTVGVDQVFFQIFHSSNVIFDDCYFTNNRWHMISFTTTTGSGVRNSRFESVGNYLKGTANYPFTVTVSYSGGSRNFFDNNRAYDIGGDMLDAGTQSGFSLQHNTVVGDNAGAIFPGGSGAGSAMYVFGSSVTAANSATVGAVINDNYVYGLTGNGLDLNCINDATVTGNTSVHNGGAGIALSGIDPGGNACTSNRVTITGNITKDNYQAMAGAATLTTNAITAAGSAVLNFADTTGVVAGMQVNGTSITNGTTVLSLTSTTVTMSAVATGAGVANPATIKFLNRYFQPPATNGGIWIGCAGSACAFDSIVLGSNVSTDSQTTKTQPYGLSVASLATLTNSKFAANNLLAGNLTANAFSGLLTDQGSGSNAWACWPGSSVTASGAFGSMACGFSATASGVGARAMGTSVTASGVNSDVSGSSVNDFGRVGFQGYASGQLSTSGDAQTGVTLLRGTTAAAVAVRATSNNATATGTNCVNIPNNKTASAIITLNAFDITTVSKSYTAVWGGGSVAPHLLTRGASAATTLIDGVATAISPDASRSNGTVTGIASTITADTTNGCINASFTPPTGNTDTWHHVWRVETVEVQ